MTPLSPIAAEPVKREHELLAIRFERWMGICLRAGEPSHAEQCRADAELHARPRDRVSAFQRKHREPLGAVTGEREMKTDWQLIAALIGIALWLSAVIAIVWIAAHVIAKFW